MMDLSSSLTMPLQQPYSHGPSFLLNFESHLYQGVYYELRIFYAAYSWALSSAHGNSFVSKLDESSKKNNSQNILGMLFG